MTGLKARGRFSAFELIQGPAALRIPAASACCAFFTDIPKVRVLLGESQPGTFDGGHVKMRSAE